NGGARRHRRILHQCSDPKGLLPLPQGEQVEGASGHRHVQRRRRPLRPRSRRGAVKAAAGSAMTPSFVALGDSDRPPMRAILTALLVASAILSGTAHAVLPPPGCKDSVGLGFTYVGTVNPGTAASGPPSGVPPVDVGAISVVTTDGPGGSREVTVHGGNL